MRATKPSGIGEGELFASASEEVAERVRRQAHFGYEHRIVLAADAANAKLNEYAAAVGLAQLLRWPLMLTRRRRVFDAYRQALLALPGVKLRASPRDAPATLCFRLPLRAEFVASAPAREGIQTWQWYLPPLACRPPFRNSKRVGPGGIGEPPCADALGGSLLGLPFHTQPGGENVLRVVSALGRRLADGTRAGACDAARLG